MPYCLLDQFRLLSRRDKGGTCPLLGCFADPQRIADLGELGLSLGEPGFEFAGARAQLGVLRASRLKLTPEGGGEPEVLLRALPRLRGRPCGQLRPVASRLLPHLPDDGVEQRGGQTAENQIDDGNETSADARRESEDRQRGHDGHKAGCSNAPARTSRPVLALGYSGTHAIHGRNWDWCFVGDAPQRSKAVSAACESAYVSNQRAIAA